MKTNAEKNRKKILKVLAKYPWSPSNIVAKKIHVDTPHTAPWLSQLFAAGLVVRQKMKVDKLRYVYNLPDTPPDSTNN